MARTKRAENPLVAAVSALRTAHGQPAAPASRDPYELSLWENVAYLVDDGRRREAFDALRTAVGLDPEAILATPEARLAAVIARGGMLPEMRARKLHACAAEAQRVGLPRLRDAMRGDPRARRSC